jgi:hypothetical protein
VYDVLCVQVQHGACDVQCSGHDRSHVALPVSQRKAAPAQKLLEIAQVCHFQHKAQLQQRTQKPHSTSNTSVVPPVSAIASTRHNCTMQHAAKAE